MKKSPSVFTTDELTAIARRAYESPSTFRLPLLVMCFTGCRRNEVVALCRDDVLPGNCLRISLSETRKAAVERVVELPEGLHGELVALAESLSDNSLLFGTVEPGHLGQWFCRKVLPAANVELGNRTLHSIRHTFPTDILRKRRAV
jgi:integrase